MMFVCLGNPGEEYKNTRHNVGEMFGNYLVEKMGVSLCEFEKKNIGRLLKLKNGWQVVFLDCYMNNSGPCLMGLLKIRKLKIDNLFVVHDDLDIPFGEFRVQQNRSSAGHKGVQSIIDTLGTKDFRRIRIGIGRDPQIPEEKYVLMRFNRQERKELKKLFAEIAESIKADS